MPLKESLATTPLWRLGEEWRVEENGALHSDGKAEFDSVTQLIEMRSRDIVLVDSAGTRVTLLRRGQSPRAVESTRNRAGVIQVARVAGDSVLLWRPATRQVAIIPPDGGGTRTAIADTRLGFGAVMLGAFGDGRMLVTGGFKPSVAFRASGRMIAVIPTTLYFLSPSGKIVDTLGEFTNGEQVTTFDRGTLSTFAMPYAASLLVGARAGRIFVINDGSPAVSGYDSVGKPLFVLRWNDSPTSVSAAEWARARDSLLARLPLSLRTKMGDVLAAHAVPKLPALTGLLVDDEGNAWIERTPTAPAAARKWAVVSRDGIWRGDVSVPNTVKLLYVGAATVYGTSRDALGRARLRAFVLRKSESASILRAPQSG